MKTVIGSALGILALGVILMLFGYFGPVRSQARDLGGTDGPQSAPAFTTNGAARGLTTGAVPISETSTSAPASTAGQMLVSCEPGQRALVRQVALNGQLVPQVDCVGDAAATADSGSGSDVRIVPAVYTTGAGVAQAPVVYRQAPARRTVTRSGRGWKKPVLIIAGSSAAGAGIGGLIGGKKGALIGAALGGGASTIYEATRR